MIEVFAATGVKPGGWVMEIVVVPAATGSNSVGRVRSPPVNVTGLVTIVPTEGSDEITATSRLAPPRTAWLLFTVWLGFNEAERIWIVVFDAPLVVDMLVGDEI